MKKNRFTPNFFVENGSDPFWSAAADTPEIHLLFVPPHRSRMEIFMIIVKESSCLEEAWELNQKKTNRIIAGMLWTK